MKQILFFLATALVFAANAQGLTEHKAIIETNNIIELRAGDSFKSKFYLKGVFGYNGKFNLKISHYVFSDIDENGNSVWTTYRTTQSYDQAVTWAQINQAWQIFVDNGLITLNDNPKQQIEKAVAYFIFTTMASDPKMWYYNMSLSDVKITVSE